MPSPRSPSAAARSSWARAGSACRDAVADGDLSSLEHRRVGPAPTGLQVGVDPAEVPTEEPAGVLLARERPPRELGDGGTELEADAGPQHAPVDAAHEHVLAGAAGRDRVALGDECVDDLGRPDAQRLRHPSVVLAGGLSVTVDATAADHGPLDRR